MTFFSPLRRPVRDAGGRLEGRSLSHLVPRRPQHVGQRALHGAQVVLVAAVLGVGAVPVVNGETQLLPRRKERSEGHSLGNT